MKTFTIRDWRTGEVIHEGEAESFKEFVEKNKQNLRDANLRVADLKDANLRSAYLRNAKLEYANFSCADLRDANLIGANLVGANFESANLEKAQISIHSKWTISIEFPNFDVENIDISGINITIGCKTKTISEWDEWFLSGEEYETKRGTLEFRKIEAMYKAYRAYVIELWS